MKFNCITVNPLQMGGVPCIRGLRIPVATVVGMVADGMTTEEILLSFPDLEKEDIILFRRQTQRRPEQQLSLLLLNLPALRKDLDAGAIVVFDQDRIRVRSLPVAE